MKSNQFKGTLIVVVGPTASGKTSVAIQLAKLFKTDIISADSRQVYKEIPIGTAAPTMYEQSEITHYLVGMLSVKDEYNASMFENDVLDILNNKLSDKEVVVMTGGSGLYIDAVCNGIDELPDIDVNLRKSIVEDFDKYGIEYLRKQLETLDKEYYKEVDVNNPKRLMRAIEVCLQTGEKYSELRKNCSVKRDFNIIKIGLKIDRDVLVNRVNHRVDLMISDGLLEEVEEMYPYKHLNSLNTVGYKELFYWMDGNTTKDEAIEKIKTNTRRYAKRQMTWFRRDKEIVWCDYNDIDEIIDKIRFLLLDK